MNLPGWVYWLFVTRWKVQEFTNTPSHTHFATRILKKMNRLLSILSVINCFNGNVLTHSGTFLFVGIWLGGQFDLQNRKYFSFSEASWYTWKNTNVDHHRWRDDEKQKVWLLIEKSWTESGHRVCDYMYLILNMVQSMSQDAKDQRNIFQQIRRHNK